MDFLGIGPLELIVVAIIALIVVGPERLPELAQSVGKTLRDLRAMSQGLTSEWQQELSTLTDIDTGEGLKETLTRPFEEAQAEIQQVLDTPLTSPTKATSNPPAPSDPPPEPPSEHTSLEHPDTSDDEADHVDT